MPRQSTITQADVDAICARLLDAGKTPTQRLVIAEHGSGSQGTVQPLLKDWQQRHRAANPVQPDHVLSPEVLKTLSKQFAHDVRLTTATLNDQLEASEEANADLARENSMLQANLHQRDAELALLADQDAVVRGQAAQLETDLNRARADYEAERHSRIDCERQAAVASMQLTELRVRFNQVSNEVEQGLAREQRLTADVAAMRVAAATRDALLDAVTQNVARLEAELGQSRQAEQIARQTAAELRGQLNSNER